MQILASALPGFRDVRAPLTAGYFWLVFLWILTKPDLDIRPTNDIAAAVYDLGKSAGPFWIGLGVGVAAYLVGSVSQALSSIFGAMAYALWEIKPEYQMVNDFQKEALRKSNPELGVMEIMDQLQEKDASTHRRQAASDLEKDLRLPATLLIGGDPQVFSEADRLKAEGELRLAVVPPLIALATFLTWNQSWWWTLGLILITVLLWQANDRNLAFRSLMVDAVRVGVVRSQSFDDFKHWVHERYGSAERQRIE